MQRADSARGGVTACLAGVAALAAPGPGASAQTVLPREFALLGMEDPDVSTWETTLAVGGDRVIAVVHAGANPMRIGYAVASLDPNAAPNSAWTWSGEGLIDENKTELDLSDPSIAYDPVTGNFLACALAAPNDIYVAHFYSGGSPPSFGAWSQAYSDPNSNLDRPWIISGETILRIIGDGFGPAVTMREFYITWVGSSKLQYLRSTNGGASWVGGDALRDLDDPNSTISDVIWPRCSVYEDGDLYVEYTDTTTTALRFVRARDVDSGSHDGEVRFRRLRLNDQGAGFPPLEIGLHRPAGGVANLIPGQGDNPGRNTAIAVDPTNPDKLYVVYHDAPDANSTDMNVYFQSFTRDPNHPLRYSFDSVGPVQVDDDDTDNESDQFMPNIAVDEDGGIHVIFYDDRKYTDPDPNDPNASGDQQPDNADPNAVRYDVFYAYKDPNATSFQANQELCDDPPNCNGTAPALDFGLPTNGFGLRDYIGIAAGTDRVFTSFMGTSTQDNNNDKSVIWGNEILLPGP